MAVIPIEKYRVILPCLLKEDDVKLLKVAQKLLVVFLGVPTRDIPRQHF